MPESVVGDITAFMVDRMYRSWDEDKKKAQQNEMMKKKKKEQKQSGKKVSHDKNERTKLFREADDKEMTEQVYWRRRKSLNVT